MKKFRRNAHKLSTRAKPVRELAKARKGLVQVLTEVGKGNFVPQEALEEMFASVMEKTAQVQKIVETPTNRYTLEQVLEAYAKVNIVRLSVHDIRLKIGAQKRAYALSGGQYEIPRTPTNTDLARMETRLAEDLKEAYRMEMSFRKATGLR